MDTKTIITIQKCVYDVLNDLGSSDENQYTRFLQFALRGVTHLNLHHINSFKRATIAVSSINTVQLPDDYVDYLRIGICINGKIWTLTRNDKICLPDTMDCGEDDAAVESADEYLPYFHYGASGGVNYVGYRVDKERHRIVFDGTVPSNSIILEYISTGISQEGTTYIPIEAREAVIAWIHWKRTEHDTTLPEVAKARYFANYCREVRTLEQFQKSFTLDDLMDVIYSSYRQTPKR